jgi:hypothetical protein
MTCLGTRLTAQFFILAAGYGTFMLQDPNVVKMALEVGYRHLDCAAYVSRAHLGASRLYLLKRQRDLPCTLAMSHPLFTYLLCLYLLDGYRLQSKSLFPVLPHALLVALRGRGLMFRVGHNRI